MLLLSEGVLENLTLLAKCKIGAIPECIGGCYIYLGFAFLPVEVKVKSVVDAFSSLCTLSPLLI